MVRTEAHKSCSPCPSTTLVLSNHDADDTSLPSSPSVKRNLELSDEAGKQIRKAKKEKTSSSNDITFKCRPQQLCEIILHLTNEQRAAVKSIGFGGLLHLHDLTHISWFKFYWFFQNFNAKSRVLKFPCGRLIVLTADSIRDLFLLPNNEDNDVLFYDKRDEACVSFVNDFKTRFDLQKGDNHSKLRDLLKEVRMQSGGDDFKRLFVLYSVSCFLGATSNTTIDFTILRSLIDVKRISSFNWCKLVMERICRGLSCFPKTNIGGCAIAIPLLYFHQFMWLGDPTPSSLPLIRHWTTEKINARLNAELSAAQFGEGKWADGVYPVSRKSVSYEDEETEEQKNKFCEETVKETEQDEDGKEEDGWIKFKLPESEKTYNQIKEAANDVLHEALLIFQRDVTVISQFHFKKMRKLKASTLDVKQCDNEISSSGQPSLPPNVDGLDIDDEYSKIFENPAFHKYIDDMIEQYTSIKESAKATEAKKMEKKKGKKQNQDDDDSFPRPTFDLLTPLSEQEEGEESEEKEQEKVEVTCSLDAIMEAINEEQELQNHKQKVNAPINPWYREDDFCWNVDNEKSFKSYFMKKNEKLFSGLSRKQKDVIDFCFFSHNENDVKFNVFAHQGKFFTYFSTIASLKDGELINSLVVDTWSLLVNKAEAFNAYRSKNERAYRFFYSTQHSHYLEKLLLPKDNQEKEQKQSSLHGCWDYYLELLNFDIDVIIKSDIIFFPICYQKHYLCAVVDFQKMKIHYLDNQKSNARCGTSFWNIVQILQEQFALYLDGIKHPQAEEFRSYPIENVPFQWQKTATNVDCGVFLMNHMQNFFGECYQCRDLCEAPRRRKLRGIYASQIILAEVNEIRAQTMRKILKFVSK